MDNNHPHYVWAFVVIVGIGITAWIYSSNRANDSTYEKGAEHNESVSNNYPLSFNFGCARFNPDGTMVKPHQEVKKK